MGRHWPNEPIAAFQVAPAVRAAYLGTMLMHIESGRNRETGKPDYELTAVGISDEFGPAERVLAARHPDHAGPVDRKPMIADQALQDLFENYSKRECERILGRHGLKLLSPGDMRQN